MVLGTENIKEQNKGQSSDLDLAFRVMKSFAKLQFPYQVLL